MSCTSSPALPVFDTLVAAGSVAWIAWVAHRQSECPPNSEHCGQGSILAVPAIPVLLVSVPSALYGYGKVSSCRSYKRSNKYEAGVVEDLEAQIRALAAEKKCTEMKPLWDELIAREQELNFEHNIEFMVIAPCADVLGVPKPRMSY